MATRIQPVRAGESPDPGVNAMLTFSKNGFQDAEMFGVLARSPELVKRIGAVFEYLFGAGRIEPYLLELMRIRAGQLNACTY